MPFELELPTPLRALWKVKIREDERLEPPHVTILRRRRAWRLDLRTGRFLDRGDSWTQIDRGVRTVIEEHWGRLCAEWDRKYPSNPVGDGDEG